MGVDGFLSGVSPACIDRAPRQGLDPLNQRGHSRCRHTYKPLSFFFYLSFPFFIWTRSENTIYSLASFLMVVSDTRLHISAIKSEKTFPFFTDRDERIRPPVPLYLWWAEAALNESDSPFDFMKNRSRVLYLASRLYFCSLTHPLPLCLSHMVNHSLSPSNTQTSVDGPHRPSRHPNEGQEEDSTDGLSYDISNFFPKRGHSHVELIHTLTHLHT